LIHIPHAQSGADEMSIARHHTFALAAPQMTKRFDSLAARAAPALFVLLWSTGFIGTKYALEGAEPFTMQTLRMTLVVILLAVFALTTRPVWPDRVGVMHSVVASILVHGFYLGGTAVAIAHSVPAGLSALIPGLQPVLTSTLANRFLGERVSPMQWLGLLLGLSGVVLVLHNRSFEGQSLIGWAASGVSLVSITVGTLYQKRFCSQIDWRAGNLIQFAAVWVFFGLGALMFETRTVTWSPTFVLGAAWLAVVLSVGSIGLLYWLIRHSAATRVASFFYLVPGVTALMAYVLFDERLDPLSIAGMVVCAAGVVLVNRR
jgi:drug/metabolite transporter (DMT)-like permease